MELYYYKREINRQGPEKRDERVRHTTINKLFEAAQSAADGQLGLYEINKGSLIAVLTYTLLAIQSHKTIVKALWPHKPQTFLQQEDKLITFWSS